MEKGEAEKKEVVRVCKRCKQIYSPSSNSSSSCRYHPSFFVCRRHDDQRSYRIELIDEFVSYPGQNPWKFDLVAEVKRQAAILKFYIEGRGNTAVPEGYLSCKVICPNPNFRAIRSDCFPPKVVAYKQWIQLKPELKSVFSGRIKGAFLGGKKEMQESIQKLNFVLSTAWTWDRLELNGNKYLFGEFLDFKGKRDDVQSLKAVKGSKVV